MHKRTGRVLLTALALVALSSLARADDAPATAPPTAPFTPTSSEMQPPAPYPPLGLPSDIEETFRVMQAKQTVSTASKREQSIADVPLTISRRAIATSLTVSSCFRGQVRKPRATNASTS